MSDPLAMTAELSSRPALRAELAELLATHRERLLRMVRFRMDRRLAGRLDPEDVLQEAFVQADQRIEHFPQNSGGESEGLSAFIWLRLIVQQTLIDAHRRHLGAQRRDAGREVSLATPASPADTSLSIAGRLVGAITSPSQAALRNEREAQLAATLAKLSELDQEVIALRHFEQLSNSEVAAVLGIETKAASIRYVRALKRLKALLTESSGLTESGALSHA
jgi:RNA polymerase sigma-70 factor, ECF subfamily